MATAKKHAERSKVTKHHDIPGRNAFFNRCMWCADIRKRAKGNGKES